MFIMTIRHYKIRRVVFLACIFVCMALCSLETKSQVPQGKGYDVDLFTIGVLNNVEIDMPDSIWESFLVNADKKENHVCDVTINGERFKNVAIRTKGASSLDDVKLMGSDRYSFMLALNKYKKGQKYHGLSKISLNNNIWDATQMKDYIVYDMCRFIGLPAPLANYTKVMLNGRYFGCYLLVEPVAKNFCERNYPDEVSNIYKPYHNLAYTGENMDDYKDISSFAKVNGDDRSMRRIVDALRSVDTGADIDKHVDVECLMKYMALQTIAVNFDCMTGKNTQNYFLREAGGRISLIPWDYNLAWGGYPDEDEDDFTGPTEGQDWNKWFESLTQEMRDSLQEAKKKEITKIVNFPIDTPFTTDLSKRTFFMKLLANEEYKARYYHYLTVLAKDYILGGEFKKAVSVINQEIGAIVSTEKNAFYTKEQYEKAVETFLTVLEKRADSVLGQINGDIPKTWDSQASNPQKLIGCEGININDLGGI